MIACLLFEMLTMKQLDGIIRTSLRNLLPDQAVKATTHQILCTRYPINNSCCFLVPYKAIISCSFCKFVVPPKAMGSSDYFWLFIYFLPNRFLRHHSILEWLYLIVETEIITNKPNIKSKCLNYRPTKYLCFKYRKWMINLLQYIV